MSLSLVAALALAAAADASAYEPARLRERDPRDEVVYFVLPDRFENGDTTNDTGGIAGDRLAHGFDPTHKGFYHGGDLKGLTARLDYIEGLGATAIWLGPIYKNKPVQGRPGEETSGYHGYWITDFTDVDPHFGTREDLKAFVEAAHKRGMKVYLDIITNHTADVIAYRECHDPATSGPNVGAGDCAYRPVADYPYSTRGAVSGVPINDGFKGDKAPHQTAQNFEKLVDPTYAYTPFIPVGEESVKKPAWLNDPKYYHNRGNSTFVGESVNYGDFSGLDDLMTEDPRVVQGFIDIYGQWISDFKIDGFRIDTARHVNPEFWQAFLPAMKKRAADEGIPNFYIFGESWIGDVAELAAQARASKFEQVLDFPMLFAINKVLAEGEAPQKIGGIVTSDIAYDGGAEAATRLPVFAGNHDYGRFAGELQRKRPNLSANLQLAAVKLAHALLFFNRGVPVIYYGDEQGFAGDGGDQAARENMFPSKVDSYNDNTLVGTNATTAQSNFDVKHPLYRAIGDMARAYRKHPALRRSVAEVRRADGDKGGVGAIARKDGEREYIFVFNTSEKPVVANVETATGRREWQSVMGDCPKKSAAPGVLQTRLPAFGFAVCLSEKDSQ
jgi:glycosidase